MDSLVTWRKMSAFPKRIDPVVAKRVVWWTAYGLGLVSAAGLAIIWHGNPSNDFHAYYVVDVAQPYADVRLGSLDAFWYSPPAAIAFAAFRALPFDAAATLFRVINLTALVWLAGPATGLVMWALPVAVILRYGNIEILLAAAILAGFRWPGTWAVILLTKPSSGIGLLYFALRGEWRRFGIALGTTVAIAGTSFLVNPDAWATYVTTLVSANAAGAPFGVPLWPRLALGLVVVVVGAWRKWEPSVVIGAWLALPVWWPSSPALLLGLLYWAPWRRPPATRPLMVAPQPA
jgi:hypothetical protein